MSKHSNNTETNSGSAVAPAGTPLLTVENVSTHRLGPELAQSARTLVEASKSFHWASQLDELSDKRTAEKAGAAGDEDGFGHVR